MATNTKVTPPDSEAAVEAAIKAIQQENAIVDAAVADMEAAGNDELNNKNSDAYKALQVFATQLGLTDAQFQNLLANPSSKAFQDFAEGALMFNYEIFGGGGFYDIGYDDLVNVATSLSADQAAITTDENTITTYYSSANFQSMNATLNALLDAPGQILGQGVLDSDYAKDLQNLMTIFGNLMAALKKQCDAAEEAKIMQVAANDTNPADAAFDMLIMLQAATRSVSDQSEEQTALADNSTVMDKMFQGYNKAWHDADTDLSSIHWWNEWFGSGDEDEARDHAIERNATFMENLIIQIRTDLAPIIVSLSPETLLASVQMDDMLKKLVEVMKEPNSAGKLKEILSLLMGLLSLLGQVVQAASKEKAEISKEMATAAQEAAEMGIQNEMDTSKKMDNERAYAKIMGTIMKVAMVVVGVIMTCLAPGVGSALAMAMITALEASGVMDTITQKLTSALADAGCPGAKYVAEVIVAVVEIVCTLGAGAALDAGEDVAEKALVAVVEDSVEDGLESAAKDAADDATQGAAGAGNAVDPAIAADTKVFLTDGAKSAGKKAAEKAFMQYNKQNIIALAKTAVKDALKDGEKTALQEVMTQAYENAAKDFIEQSSKFAEKIAQGGALSDVEQAEVAEIEEQCANQSVADLTNSTAKQVAKDTTGEGKWMITKALESRGVQAGLYALGSSHLLLQGVTAIGDAEGKKDDKSFQNFLIFVQVLEQMLIMIAMAGGGGATNMGSSSGLSALKLVAAAGTGAQAVADYGTYQADTQKAGAEEELAHETAMLDVVNFLRDQITKDGNEDRERALKDLETLMHSTYAIGAHVYDGLAAGAMAEQRA